MDAAKRSILGYQISDNRGVGPCILSMRMALKPVSYTHLDVYKRQVVWYQLGELMKNAKERVKIHTPYIICNDMMYNTWEEIAQKVSHFSIMTNSCLLYTSLP